MSESLFSLELHVESVDRVKVSCVIPAVSFRLLDYPTLIIHLVSPASTHKLLQKSRIQGIPKEQIEAELRDRYGNLPFQKGKSCLFKANITNLQKQLESTPLYIMLIDLWYKKPKLIGSTVISLSDVVSKISSDVKRFGISVPSVCQDEGTFDIFNLMGSVIGKINLCFRLLSLGGSLMSHILAKSIMPRKGEEKSEKGGTSTDRKDLSLELEDKNVKQDKELILEVKRSGSEQQDSETQTEHPLPTSRKKLQIKKPIYIENKVEEIFPVTNTVCPPPLFYNFMSHSENLGNKKSEQEEKKEAYTSKTSCEVGIDDIDFIYYKPDLLQPDGSIGCASVCIQTEEVSTAQPIVSDKDDKDRNVSEIEKRLNSEDLPLLNALLEELSSLRSKSQTLSAPVTMQSNTPRKENIKPKTKLPLRPRECCLRVAAQKSVLLKSKKQSQDVQKKVKFKQTNLTYGTTRTQLMRLEMNQKGKGKNPRIRGAGMEDKRLPSSAYSRERNEIVKNVVPEDFGKTHMIFKSPGAVEESLTVSAGVQTDVLLESLIPEPSSDANGMKPASENLGKTVTVMKQQNNDTQADAANSSTRSLPSQNSLDIYLPQVEGDSDGSSNFGPASEQVSSDDVPLPELPTTTATRYGHTGIRSPDLPEAIRRQSVTSPPIKSRTSTALSMYSDDFEESLIWEAKSQSEDDKSDTSSHTSSISYLSANSQTKDRNVSQASSSNDINDNYSQPIMSNFSPKKSKKLTERKTKVDQDDNGSVQKSFKEDSKSDNGITAVETPDIDRESLFDSLKSPKPDGHLDDGVLTREGNDDNQNVLQLPRPAIDLGYTY